MNSSLRALPGPGKLGLEGWISRSEAGESSQVACQTPLGAARRWGPCAPGSPRSFLPHCRHRDRLSVRGHHTGTLLAASLQAALPTAAALPEPVSWQPLTSPDP